MKIAIDAMGGDFAPLEIVLGALEAVRETEHIDVVLVGDKTQIFKILEDNNETNNPRISVYHASQVIGMDEHPGQALRKKKDASVVVAGSIVDGRGLAAALLMGAEGVQMGSRFLLAEECKAHQNMKEAIIKATDTDSVVTGLLSGHGGVRSLRSDFTDRYIAAETDGVTTKEERSKMSQGTNKLAAIDGDVVNGAVQVGQALNRLNEIEPAQTIVHSVINEAIMAIRKAQRFIEVI